MVLLIQFVFLFKWNMTYCTPFFHQFTNLFARFFRIYGLVDSA